MNISGVHRSPRLRCLDRVFRRWIRLNGRLAERWLKQKDCPWWYKERALLGTFCGSLWLSDSDNVALEEYSDSKREMDKRGRLTPDTYPGRVDLYFEVGSHRFIAESKHVWVAARRRSPQTDKIRECIRRASDDIRQSKPDRGIHRLVIVFAAPYIRGKWKSPVTQQELRDLRGWALWSVEQAQMTNSDAVAWTFPRLGRYGIYKGGICPGVIMLLKEVAK